MERNKSMPPAETQPKKKRMTFKMPDAYVLLFMIAFIGALASSSVPAGEFDRVTKGDV
ncbi:YfcC family protein, partial [Bacillus subtilis]|nr:YfcC family protein [Bacillus subtilis]